jgi:hypothetical protein
MLPEDWKKQIDEAANKAGAAAANASEHVAEVNREIAAKIDVMTNESKSYHAKQESGEKTKQRRENITIATLVASAFASFALAIVALLQWSTLEKTDSTLKDTLAANKLEQRAWVYPTSDIVGPLTFKDNRVQLPLKFTFWNTGHLPAPDSWVWVNIYPVAPDSEIAAMKERPAACITPADSFLKTGVAVFPGASVPLATIIVEPPIGRTLSDGPHILIIAGCVIYRSGMERPLHGTVFVAALVHETRGITFDKADGDVSGSLSLFRAPTGEEID